LARGLVTIFPGTLICLAGLWRKMGCSSSADAGKKPKKEKNGFSKILEEAEHHAEERCGTVAVTGRYHRLPKRLTHDYDLQVDILGSGYSGNVYLATGKHCKGRFAVKGFKLTGLPEGKQQELVAEVDVFLSVDHPNIVRLVDVFEAEDMLYMVMECMEGGELFETLQARKSFSEQDAADLTWQMLLAVNYLHHEMHVVHRDLKLENFLFVTKNSTQIKLIDFGFSRIWDQGHDKKMTWNVGTLLYMAPEVLKSSYTSQCDMWSLGVIVFLLLSGKEPFTGSMREMQSAISKGSYQMNHKRWNKVSDLGKDFVRALLVVNPEERMTAKKALEHPWITEREADKLNHAPHVDKGIADGLLQYAQVGTFRKACMTMMALSLSAEEEAELHDAFLAADTGHTGALHIGEFKSVMEEHFDLHDEDIQKIFDAIDSNHDHTIHYSEFLSACMMSKVNLSDDLLEGAFHRFDTHEAGKITADDLQGIFGSSISKDEAVQFVRQVSSSSADSISHDEFLAYMKNGETRLSKRLSQTLQTKDQTPTTSPTGRSSFNRRVSTQSNGAATGGGTFKSKTGSASPTINGDPWNRKGVDLETI